MLTNYAELKHLISCHREYGANTVFQYIDYFILQKKRIREKGRHWHNQNRTENDMIEEEEEEEEEDTLQRLEDHLEMRRNFHCGTQMKEKPPALSKFK